MQAAHSASWPAFPSRVAASPGTSVRRSRRHRWRVEVGSSRRRLGGADRRRGLDPELVRVRVRAASGAVTNSDRPSGAKAVAMSDRDARSTSQWRAGFTLIETLIAMALMGLILSSLVRSPRNGCRTGIAASIAFSAAKCSALRFIGSARISPPPNTSRQSRAAPAAVRGSGTGGDVRAHRDRAERHAGWKSSGSEKRRKRT